MRDVDQPRRGELGQAFMDWFSEFRLTAAVTVSWNFTIHEDAQIPCKFERHVERLVSALGRHCSDSVGCLGLIVTTPTGRVHAHFMLLKESSQSFTQSELTWICRRTRINTKAEEIFDLEGLSAYLGSNHHLVYNHMRYITLAFGTTALKSSKKRVQNLPVAFSGKHKPVHQGCT